MSSFDEFDLDLQAIKATPEGEVDAKSVTGAVTCNCTTATIDSIAHCTRNGQWYSCMCSTCCGGHTSPQGCSVGC